MKARWQATTASDTHTTHKIYQRVASQLCGPTPRGSAAGLSHGGATHHSRAHQNPAQSCGECGCQCVSVDMGRRPPPTRIPCTFLLTTHLGGTSSSQRMDSTSTRPTHIHTPSKLANRKGCIINHSHTEYVLDRNMMRSVSHLCGRALPRILLKPSDSDPQIGRPLCFKVCPGTLCEQLLSRAGLGKQIPPVVIDLHMRNTFRRRLARTARAARQRRRRRRRARG